jgi:hypothetical protein
MRTIPLLLTAAALTSCTTQPPAPTRTAEGQAKFQRLTAGKIAGKPMDCLPHYRTNEMVTIDDQTIAFRQGGRVYVNHLINECNGLDNGFYTLVTTSHGNGLCRGDISKVSDIRTGMTVGACAIGTFVPYTTASR